MSSITEIAPDVFRICTYVSAINMQFNQFLVRDEEPLLFHTGMRSLFPIVLQQVNQLIQPEQLRWVGFSHFEADECGSLNEWLAIAPSAQAVCSHVGAMVSVNDFATRPALGLQDGETLDTGRHSFRLLHTPHLPHCWEASHLFEELHGVLFCSDLFHQNGDLEPITESSIVDRARATLVEIERSPMNHYLPYTPNTEPLLSNLAALKPRVVAPMHGSAFAGNGERALLDLGTVFREVLGKADIARAETRS